MEQPVNSADEICTNEPLRTWPIKPRSTGPRKNTAGIRQDSDPGSRAGHPAGRRWCSTHVEQETKRLGPRGGGRRNMDWPLFFPLNCSKKMKMVLSRDRMCNPLKVTWPSQWTCSRCKRIHPFLSCHSEAHVPLLAPRVRVHNGQTLPTPAPEGCQAWFICFAICLERRDSSAAPPWFDRSRRPAGRPTACQQMLGVILFLVVITWICRGRLYFWGSPFKRERKERKKQR